jgi:hypothetical protein
VAAPLAAPQEGLSSVSKWCSKSSNVHGIKVRDKSSFKWLAVQENKIENMLSKDRERVRRTILRRNLGRHIVKTKGEWKWLEIVLKERLWC